MFGTNMALMFFCCCCFSTGAHEEIDYSAKLKFSDDEGEEEVEEERSESKNDLRYVLINSVGCLCLTCNNTILTILRCVVKNAVFSSVSSRGPRMPPLQPLVLEPRTAVETTAAPLPLMLTMAPNLPPVSQDGPRREAVAGEAREHHPTTR